MHIQVHNTTGPTPKALPPLEQLKQDLQPSVSPWIRASLMRGGPSAGGLLGLTERVGNMEQYTHLYEGRFGGEWGVTVQSYWYN